VLFCLLSLLELCPTKFLNYVLNILSPEASNNEELTTITSRKRRNEIKSLEYKKQKSQQRLASRIWVGWAHPHLL
jgi:hypothetical protein